MASRKKAAPKKLKSFEETLWGNPVEKSKGALGTFVGQSGPASRWNFSKTALEGKS